MVLSVQQPVLELRPGQVLSLNDAAGVRIVARAGTLWVTEEGLYADHIVERGDSLVISRGGLTLVQALDTATIAIH